MSRSINPAMITLARESRGVTQSDFALRLEVTQGKVSKKESGHLGVSDAELTLISQELGYPEHFFFQTDQVYPAGMHLYRKHKTLPARDLYRITAWMNVYRLHVKRLLQAAEVDYEQLPELDVDEYESPAEVARAIREYARIPRGPIQNISSVLEDLGIIIVLFDPGTRMFSGASMMTERPNYIVVANDQMPGDRYRWTLAHELGHMVMHRTPTPNMEEEADAFAREFLMPTEEIRPFLTNLSLPQLAGLKKHWRVSMSAILQHATDTGVITERQERRLWTKMAAAGITRTKEPPELDSPIDPPTLLTELFDYHINELGYGIGELADLLAINPNEFHHHYTPSNTPLRVVRAPETPPGLRIAKRR